MFLAKSIKYDVYKQKDIFGRRCTLIIRADNSAMGRFGGGWDFKVGLQSNKSWTTVIVSFGVGYIRIDKLRR